MKPTGPLLALAYLAAFLVALYGVAGLLYFVERREYATAVPFGAGTAMVGALLLLRWWRRGSAAGDPTSERLLGALLAVVFGALYAYLQVASEPSTWVGIVVGVVLFLGWIAVLADLFTGTRRFINNFRSGWNEKGPMDA